MSLERQKRKELTEREADRLAEEQMEPTVEMPVPAGAAVGTGTTKLFKITGNANSGGYYTAYEQQFDATDWKTTTDPLGNNIGDEIEIWNLAEAGNTGTNYLAANEYVFGWQIIDDEGNRRWVCCKYMKSCT